MRDLSSRKRADDIGFWLNRYEENDSLPLFKMNALKSIVGIRKSNTSKKPKSTSICSNRSQGKTNKVTTANFLRNRIFSTSTYKKSERKNILALKMAITTTKVNTQTCKITGVTKKPMTKKTTSNNSATVKYVMPTCTQYSTKSTTNTSKNVDATKKPDNPKLSTNSTKKSNKVSYELISFKNEFPQEPEIDIEGSTSEILSFENTKVGWQYKMMAAKESLNYNFDQVKQDKTVESGLSTTQCERESKSSKNTDERVYDFAEDTSKAYERYNKKNALSQHSETNSINTFENTTEWTNGIQKIATDENAIKNKQFSKEFFDSMNSNNGVPNKNTQTEDMREHLKNYEDDFLYGNCKYTTKTVNQYGANDQYINDSIEYFTGNHYSHNLDMTDKKEGPIFIGNAIDELKNVPAQPTRKHEIENRYVENEYFVTLNTDVLQAHDENAEIPTISQEAEDSMGVTNALSDTQLVTLERTNVFNSQPYQEDTSYNLAIDKNGFVDSVINTNDNSKDQISNSIRGDKMFPNDVYENLENSLSRERTYTPQVHFFTVSTARNVPHHPDIYKHPNWNSLNQKYHLNMDRVKIPFDFPSRLYLQSSPPLLTTTDKEQINDESILDVADLLPTIISPQMSNKSFYFYNENIGKNSIKASNSWKTILPDTQHQRFRTPQNIKQKYLFDKKAEKNIFTTTSPSLKNNIQMSKTLRERKNEELFSRKNIFPSRGTHTTNNLISREKNSFSQNITTKFESSIESNNIPKQNINFSKENEEEETSRYTKIDCTHELTVREHEDSTPLIELEYRKKKVNSAPESLLHESTQSLLETKWRESWGDYDPNNIANDLSYGSRWRELDHFHEGPLSMVHKTLPDLRELDEYKNKILKQLEYDHENNFNNRYTGGVGYDSRYTTKVDLEEVTEESQEIDFGDINTELAVRVKSLQNQVVNEEMKGMTKPLFKMQLTPDEGVMTSEMNNVGYHHEDQHLSPSEHPLHSLETMFQEKAQEDIVHSPERETFSGNDFPLESNSILSISKTGNLKLKTNKELIPLQDYLDADPSDIENFKLIQKLLNHSSPEIVSFPKSRNDKSNDEFTALKMTLVKIVHKLPNSTGLSEDSPGNIFHHNGHKINDWKNVEDLYHMRKMKDTDYIHYSPHPQHLSHNEIFTKDEFSQNPYYVDWKSDIKKLINENHLRHIRNLRRRNKKGNGVHCE